MDDLLTYENIGKVIVWGLTLFFMFGVFLFAFPEPAREFIEDGKLCKQGAKPAFSFDREKKCYKIKLEAGS